MSTLYLSQNRRKEKGNARDKREHSLDTMIRRDRNMA